jgi:DUF4097 and DUF4098 domain-containing protein YvlB
MRRSTAVLLATLCATLASVDAAEHRETVTRSFTIAGADGTPTLVVDTVEGAIDVQGSSGGTVELTLVQTYRADSAEDLAKARSEVQLEVTDEPGRLELVQGGPWRCRDKRKDCWCCNEDRNYQVRYDWTLRVPKHVEVELRAVNDGAIRVRGMEGRLAVRHVNDDVTLEGAKGPVSAETVNGALTVDFVSGPAGDCRFGTINGDIDLVFPKGFGAELSFATMNGEVYTDFPFVLGKLPATTERKTSGNRKRYELGRSTRATIGKGGIGLQCDTLNGDIHIRERS